MEQNVNPQAKPATKVKVTVHIPEKVRDKQQRINRIYDILKPKSAAQA